MILNGFHRGMLLTRMRAELLGHALGIAAGDDRLRALEEAAWKAERIARFECDHCWQIIARRSEAKDTTS